MNWKILFTILSAATGVAARTRFQRQLYERLQRNVQPSGDDIDPTKLYSAHRFTTPVDHFHNDTRYAPHSNGTFEMRYWFDDTYYKPGGPVLVLCSGESEGEARLPYLQKGIIYELAKATNGLGVVLEHRYYGDSFPVKAITKESLRFLTTDQSMADTAYFANNAVFPGLEKYNLTANSTPWIAYGGSYAGAYVAIMRTLYPDAIWGAISSSGVSQAQWDFWQYYNAAATYLPPDCVNKTKVLVHAMDTVLLHNTSYTQQLKALWNMTVLPEDATFMDATTGGVAALQDLNWDPSISLPGVWEWCSNVSASTILYDGYEAKVASAEEVIAAGGYADQANALAPHLLNWIGWILEAVLKPANATGQNLAEMFHTPRLGRDNQGAEWLDDGWSWNWQVCTQWGFMQVGSTVPADQLPMISRTITLEYTSEICRSLFNISAPANTSEINKYGGYHISYPRLAQIGGEWDPWRPVTPMADQFLNKSSTLSEPRILISKAVHHWDENGLFPNETTSTLPPTSIRSVHSQQAKFVSAWVQEFHQQQK